jgi:predicted transcriptional regulator
MEILRALNQRFSNPTNLLSEFKIDYNTMKDSLDFLMKQQLVAKRNCGNNSVFKNTKRGKNVLKYFNELENRVSNVDLGIDVAGYQKRRQIL